MKGGGEAVGVDCAYGTCQAWKVSSLKDWVDRSAEPSFSTSVTYA